MNAKKLGTAAGNGKSPDERCTSYSKFSSNPQAKNAPAGAFDEYCRESGAPKKKSSLTPEQADAVTNRRLSEIRKWALINRVDFERDDDADIFLKAAYPHWPPEKRTPKTLEAFVIGCGGKRLPKHVELEHGGWSTRRPTAEQLGKMLGVTHEAREKHQLWQMLACDKDAIERAALKRAKHRMTARKSAADARRRQGRKTRAEYLANALTATEPWKADGVSRRTWERRKKKQRTCVVVGVLTNSIDTQDQPTCDSKGGLMPQAKARKVARR